jgi:hypothetical protein
MLRPSGTSTEDSSSRFWCALNRCVTFRTYKSGLPLTDHGDAPIRATAALAEAGKRATVRRSPLFRSGVDIRKPLL